MPKFQGDKKFFAAIPARAFLDNRLGLRHLRLLGLIALHDRLNRNGVGCYAKRKRLAKLLGWDETSVSHVLVDLRGFGYVATTPDPNERRSHVHRVLYDYALDHNWDSPNRCHQTHLNRCHQTHLSTDDRCHQTHQIGAYFQPKIGASPCDDEGTPSEAYASKHISKNLRGDEKAYCAEPRSRRRRNLTPEQAKKYLDHCEKILASGNDAERQQLRIERPQFQLIATDEFYAAEDRDRASRLLDPNYQTQTKGAQP